MPLVFRDSGYGIQVGMLVEGLENVSNFMQLFGCYVRVCFNNSAAPIKHCMSGQVS